MYGRPKYLTQGRIDQVNCAMVRHTAFAQGRVHRKSNLLAFFQQAGKFMQEHLRDGLLHIVHAGNFFSVCQNNAFIAHLSAGFGIERSAVKNSITFAVYFVRQFKFVI